MKADLRTLDLNLLKTLDALAKIGRKRRISLSVSRFLARPSGSLKHAAGWRFAYPAYKLAIDSAR
ncbi:MAG: hypothetical protein ACRCZ6_21095 [Kluyvera sp.]|uniref:hypothetical protein n=1 Tax=Kluyvera sp. TaxID=1538228 RepID=UPI003F3B84C7